MKLQKFVLIVLRSFTAACLLGVTVMAHNPHFHEWMHGHDHSLHVHEHAQQEDAGAPADHDSGKPCKTCTNCRFQNHFALREASPVSLDFVFSIPPTNASLLYEFHPSFYFFPSILGRAPPALS